MVNLTNLVMKTPPPKTIGPVRNSENPLEATLIYEAHLNKKGIKTGTYRHFKGKKYEFMGTVSGSELMG